MSEALEHTEEAVRIEASYALAQIGDSAETAIAALIEHAKDEAVEVRRYLAEAFGSIGPARSTGCTCPN